MVLMSLRRGKGGFAISSRHLLIPTLIGAFTMLGGLYGLTLDTYFRVKGSEVAAVISDTTHDGGKRLAVETYEVGGKSYRLTSMYGPGAYNFGDVHTVLFDPANPSSAREAIYLGVDFLLAVFGCVLLIVCWLARRALRERPIRIGSFAA